MTFAAARKVIAQRVRALGLPADLHGAEVRLAEWPDEDLLKFVKTEESGGISAEEQKLLNRAFAEEIRKRNGRVVMVPVDAKKYFAWLAKNNLENSPAARAQFISLP